MYACPYCGSIKESPFCCDENHGIEVTDEEIAYMEATSATVDEIIEIREAA